MLIPFALPSITPLFFVIIGIWLIFLICKNNDLRYYICSCHTIVCRLLYENFSICSALMISYIPKKFNPYSEQISSFSLCPECLSDIRLKNLTLTICIINLSLFFFSAFAIHMSNLTLNCPNDIYKN